MAKKRSRTTNSSTRRKSKVSASQPASSAKSAKVKKASRPKKAKDSRKSKAADGDFPSQEKNGSASSGLDLPHTGLKGEKLRTLLDDENREKLPPSINQQRGPKCRLELIARYSPDLYAKMIHMIRMGASFGTAAGVLGISQSTMLSWLYKGRADQDNDVDSFFSRFVSDIYSACAVAASEAEQEVKRLDPRKWLAHGPGRIFGGSWGKDQRQPGGQTKQRALPYQGPDFLESDEPEEPLTSDDAIDVAFRINHERIEDYGQEEIEEGQGRHEGSVLENSSEGEEGRKTREANEGGSRSQSGASSGSSPAQPLRSLPGRNGSAGKGQRTNQKPQQYLEVEEDDEAAVFSVLEDTGFLTLSAEAKAAFAKQKENKEG